MATKRLRSVLDVESMTNRQLLRELAKLHDELVARLATCHEVGMDAPDALDEGILLAARLEAMNNAFQHGKSLYDDGWWSYQRKLAKLAVGVEEIEVDA